MCPIWPLILAFCQKCRRRRENPVNDVEVAEAGDNDDFRPANEDPIIRQPNAPPAEEQGEQTKKSKNFRIFFRKDNLAAENVKIY